jgi:hypothetical protein
MKKEEGGEGEEKEAQVLEGHYFHVTATEALYPSFH